MDTPAEDLSIVAAHQTNQGQTFGWCVCRGGGGMRVIPGKRICNNTNICIPFAQSQLDNVYDVRADDMSKICFAENTKQTPICPLACCLNNEHYN